MRDLVLTPIGEAFGNLFGGAFAIASVSILFAALIGATFIAALCGLRSARPQLRLWAQHAPASLTSLGMLGTFVGIFLGLIDFNVFAIDASVPTLLAGLKLAFATSILGLAAALVFKWLAPFLRPPAPAKKMPAGESARAQLLQDLMEQQLSAQRQLTQSLTRALTALAQPQAAAAQAAQTAKSSEQDAAAHRLRLEKSLSALERKISDESERNFTRIHQALQESSQALTAWQDNFRDQMIAMREAVDAVNTHIASTRNEIEQVGDMLTSLPERWQDAQNMRAA